MAAGTQGLIRKRIPWLTALLVGAPLLIYPSEVLRGALVYDRTAILHGELWRLWTGHLVHFSPEHLVADLAVVALAGGLLELRLGQEYAWLLAGSSLLVSLVLLLGLPEMARYGGLSALGSAAIAALAALGLSGAKGVRSVSLAVLLLLCVRIVWETAEATSLLLQWKDQSFVPVPLAHAVGALAGLAIGLFRRGHPASSRRRQTEPTVARPNSVRVADGRGICDPWKHGHKGRHGGDGGAELADDPPGPGNR